MDPVTIPDIISTPGGKRVCMSCNCRHWRECPEYGKTLHGELVELITDCPRYQAEKAASRAY